MEPRTYCPVVDGIPGLFPGTPSIIEEADVNEDVSRESAPDENNPRDDHHNSSGHDSEQAYAEDVTFGYVKPWK